MGEEVRGLAPSDEGKRRLWDGSSIHPLERGERRQTATHGAAARERAVAPRHCPEKEEGEGRRVGHEPEWPGGPNATWAGTEGKQRRKWNGPQG
jgi:hypothetical protein